MRLRLWILSALVACLASGAAKAVVAQAGSWTKACEVATAGTITVRGGDVLCYTPATGADDQVATPMVDVSHCENVDLELHDDYDGDATVCTVTWAIETCDPQAKNLSSDTLKNASCATLQGATSLSGDDVESNLAFTGNVRLHGEDAGTNITSCRIVLKCALEGSK